MLYSPRWIAAIADPDPVWGQDSSSLCRERQLNDACSRTRCSYGVNNGSDSTWNKCETVSCDHGLQKAVDSSTHVIVGSNVFRPARVGCHMAAVGENVLTGNKCESLFIYIRAWQVVPVIIFRPVLTSRHTVLYMYIKRLFV
jgi:hypothetical protein